MLGVLKKTLSHKWLSWNFPIFLLRLGLFTLMKIDSLINLLMSCPSLPIILKLFLLNWYPVSWLCAWMGQGSLRCSVYLSLRVLDVSLMYSPTVFGCTLVTVNDTTCVFLRVLVFGHITEHQWNQHQQRTTTPGGRPMVIPYVQGLGESIMCTVSKYGIQTHFKGNRTLKQMLVKPKDKDPKEKTSGIIYWLLGIYL